MKSKPSTRRRTPPFMYPRDERGKKVELTREQKSEMLYIYQTKLAEWMGVTIT